MTGSALAERPSTAAKRVLVSRLTLGAAGLLALIAFVWVPFLKAGNVYEAVVAPAYRLPMAPATFDPATDEFAAGGWRVAGGEALVDDPELRLDGVDAFALGRRLDADADRLPLLGSESRVVGRFLVLATGGMVVFGVFALALPWLRSPADTWVNVLVGGAGMWVFSTHVLTLGLDLTGLVDGGLFAWEHHAVAAALVVLTAIGTSAVLRADNALRVIGGTVGCFVLLGALGSAWLVAG